MAGVKIKSGGFLVFAFLLYFFKPISADTALFNLADALTCKPDDAQFSSEYNGGNIQSYFDVAPNTGEITLNQCIDRENLPEPRSFDIPDGIMLKVAMSSKDSSVGCEAQFLFIIEDVNDNVPQFQDLPYAKTINEANFTEPYYLMKAVATDKDEGEAGTVTYSITWTPQIDGVEFQILPKKGDISVNGSVNYNDNMLYYISINASDGRDKYGTVHSVTANLIVTVKDIPNLPPIFTSASYSSSIKENTAKNTEVLHVNAVDGDRGINNKIFYSISGTSYFYVDNKTGEVFVSENIDRDTMSPSTGGRAEFQLHATEIVNNTETSSSSAVNVSVVIEDVNDNPPIFYQGDIEINNITVEVPENSPTDTPVIHFENIHVKDIDEGENAKMALTVHPKNLSIYPTQVYGESPLSLRVIVPLDYELIENFTVEVNANDGVHNVMLTVLVNVENKNEYFPKFQHNNYTVNIFENVTNAPDIATIHATDKDKGTYGDVTYELDGSTEVLKNFSLNQITGILSLKNGASVDYEMKHTYFATVMAIDGGGKETSAALDINILDVNDNAPKWLPLGTLVIMEEETFQNSLFLEATDRDEPDTPNSKVSYELQSCYTSKGEDLDLVNNFTVDNSNLKIKGVLDRERLPKGINGGHLQLVIVAKDHGNPQLSSNANATVIVMDKNDNSPQFSNSRYTVSVPETTPRGTYLLNVSAVDMDVEEPNNQFRFSFNTSNTILTVDGIGKNGFSWIKLGSKLDFEKRHAYTLFLLAIDMGASPNTGETTITVHVEDVDDEPPKFSCASYTYNVNESNYNGTHTFIGSDIIGFDDDTNAYLSFEITNEKCEDNETVDVHNWIGINKTIGLLILQRDIDYETCKQLSLVIRLTDENTVVGVNSSDVDVTVNIVDQNDNSPSFINPSQSVIVITELAKEDYQVAIYKADDKDSGKNAELTFIIHDVQFVSTSTVNQPPTDLFKIVTNAPTTGKTYDGVFSLGTFSQLNSEGYYQICLIVKDHGEVSHSANVSVKVFMIPQNSKVELIFARSLDEVKEHLLDIISLLRSAVDDAQVTISNIQEETQVTRAATDARCILDSYFYYNNGTSLPVSTVMRLLNDNYEVMVELSILGLISVNPPNPPDVITPELPWQIAVGVIAGILALTLFISITSAVCMRRSFERRIKTELALRNTQAALASHGTNYEQQPHNKENPLFNKEAIELPYDDINGDVEKRSINSLDEHLYFDSGKSEGFNTLLEDVQGEDNEPHQSPILKETLRGFDNTANSLSSTAI
uniref:Cadherin domain-containing protein n=2 Tax=Eptatretus burgeri TaxID=7764 RepID=A0A8C4N7U4_EPTBU